MLRKIASQIQKALDVLLPRKDHVARLEKYSIDDFVISPVEHEVCGVRITTLLQYRTQAVEDCIRALKYDQSGYAAELLALLLGDYLREEIAQLQLFSSRPIVLIPIPLNPSRERERGFNQVARVLQNLPDDFKNGTLARIDTMSLLRTRATPQQTRLSRAKRLENVAGAFALRDTAPTDAHIILIDDVTTTGATLSEAAKPLKHATLLALAHA